MGAVLLGVLYASFGVVDAIAFPEHVRALSVTRAVVVLLMVLSWPVILADRFRETYERHVQEILLWLGVVSTGGILAMGAQVSQRATLLETIVGTLGFLVTLTFLYGFTQMRFLYSAALGSAMTAVGLYYLVVYLAAPTFLWLAIVVFGVAVHASGWWVSRTLEQLSRSAFVQEEATVAERERSERLLANALPAEIARKLRDDDAAFGAEREALAERHDAVTVLVADLVGFTPLAERLSADELARLLDRLFSAFDALADVHGVEKIKTLGDAWIAAAGAPTARDDHAVATARLALAMLDSVDELRAKTGVDVQVRIGVHTGAAVAGVIGHLRYAYDLWGDAVDGAKAMESGGRPGCARVSEATRALIPSDVPIDDENGALYLRRA
jgi:class 3 adenylate cyclase